MSDSPWSDPDATEPDGSGDTPTTPDNPDVRPLGPPSSSFPNVPDITPVSGTPIPGDVPPEQPEGTAVMPVVLPTLPPATPTPTPTPSSTPPATPPGGSGAALGVAASTPFSEEQPQYVMSEAVPWYRTPDGKARAGAALGVATLLIVAGIIFLVTRSDDGDSVVSGDSTTTTGQFSANLETTTSLDPALLPTDSTTSTVPPESTTTTLSHETTAVPATTPPPTTTTTTLPPDTTTTTSTTTTSTTTTTTSTTTTTTAPPPPPSPPEVVVPNAQSTIGEIIQASPGLSELDAVMSSVGFYSELSAISDPYTFFAPSNEAIRAVEASLPSDPEAVREFLRRHATTDGRLGSRDLFTRTEITMINGDTVRIDGAAMTVGGSKLPVTDKGGAATDQVLHVVSSALTG